MGVARFFSRAASAISLHSTITEKRLKEMLSDVVIHIEFGPSCTDQGNPKIILHALVNILSRFYPAIALSGPSPVREEVIAIAHNINPRITILDSVVSPAVRIVVGDKNADSNSLVPSASGWVTSLSSVEVLPHHGPTNPFSAGVAACLAAAETFRRVLVAYLPESSEINNITFSLLDFSKDKGVDLPLPALDIGEVAFFGLGAVANAMFWGLSQYPNISGICHLVDHETVALSNLQRYMLTTNKDDGVPKTEIALRALSVNHLTLKPASVKLEEFAAMVGSPFKIPTVCVSVDNFEGRRTAQALLPKLVLNGYTGERDLGVSWHRFGDEGRGCLACLYQGDREKSELDQMCDSLGLSMQEIGFLIPNERRLSPAHVATIERHCRVKGGTFHHLIGKHLKQAYVGLICGSLSIQVNANKKEVVPLAHQSAMAGFLLGAELIKRSDGCLGEMSQQGQLVIWENILASQPTPYIYDDLRTNGCICSDPDYRMFFKKKWDM
jgi:hypothetical protein